MRCLPQPQQAEVDSGGHVDLIEQIHTRQEQARLLGSLAPLPLPRLSLFPFRSISRPANTEPQSLFLKLFATIPPTWMRRKRGWNQLEAHQLYLLSGPRIERSGHCQSLSAAPVHSRSLVFQSCWTSFSSCICGGADVSLAHAQHSTAAQQPAFPKRHGT